MDNAARSLSGDRPARLRDAVLDVEAVADVKTITDLLAP